MKRTLSVTAVAAALLLAPLAVADAAPAAPTAFANCQEALNAGYYNIPKDDPFYAPELDGDSDGKACDVANIGRGTGNAEGDNASALYPGKGPNQATPSDESSTEDSDTSDEDGSEDSTSDDGSSDEEGTEDSSDSDQVGVVPEGGAPTGDGSTETGFGWWVGGGLLMAMAGAGLALRQRVFGRS